eukprot:gene6495-7787_t
MTYFMSRFHPIPKKETWSQLPEKIRVMAAMVGASIWFSSALLVQDQWLQPESRSYGDQNALFEVIIGIDTRIQKPKRFAQHEGNVVPMTIRDRTDVIALVLDRHVDFVGDVGDVDCSDDED